jgi:hypothetical protein
MSQGGDKVFAGSIPQLYDEYRVPLIFQPYAEDLAARVAARNPGKGLEIAAGEMKYEARPRLAVVRCSAQFPKRSRGRAEE